MISRRKVLKSGSAALLAVSSAGFYRHALAQVAAFDFYISANGDDNNPGTLASPWSITALNTRMSAYRGKRIGILPGSIRHGRVGGVATSLYSLLSAGGGNVPVLSIEGGSAAAPTVVASCDDSGFYSPRTATIDARNPSNDGYATPQKSLIGQDNGGGVTSSGNVIWDGVNVKGAVYRGIAFYRLNGVTGVTICNAHIDGGRCSTSNNNPGAIYLQNHSGVVVRNCMITDHRTLGGTVAPWGMSGIMSFNGTGLLVEHCTFADCIAIDGKNDSQDATIRYCYLDHGSFGSAGADPIIQCVSDMLPGAGKSNNIHHNVLLGPRKGHSNNGGSMLGTENFYNNTIYIPGSSYYHYRASMGSGAKVNFYNNLCYSTGNAGTDPSSIWFGGTAASGASLPTFNYNAYKRGILFAPNAYADRARSLASWQAYGGNGFDANSRELDASPFVTTPRALDIASFTPSGFAMTAGRQGAALGALDGSGRVGCDFAVATLVKAPVSPVLTIS